MSVPLTDAEVQAVVDTWAGAWLTMGPRTQELEQRVSARLGLEGAAAVASGEAALHTAFLALALGSGDEVVVPSVAGEAAATAAVRTGATAIAAEVAAADPRLNAAQAQAALTGATKAIVVVHPYGFPADTAALRELADARGVALVEDATQAFGAEGIGRGGHLTALSFARDRQFPVGEAGMVLGTDADLVARARLLRAHAMTASTWDRHRGHGYSYDVVDVGYNHRIDEPRAALAVALSDRLDELLAARRGAARALHAALVADGRTPLYGADALAAAAPLALPLDDGTTVPVEVA